MRRTLARYEEFRATPAKATRHAMRRAVVSHVMTAPVTTQELAAMPWARAAAELLGADAVEQTLRGLAERGAVRLEDGRWETDLAYEPRGPLARGPATPRDWPPAR